MSNKAQEIINIKSLEEDIDGALLMISDSGEVGVSSKSMKLNPISEDEGLYEQCSRVVREANENGNKPTLRIFSHFACTGGTLLSKCIAAQANTYVLSEVHPTTNLHILDRSPFYSPRDISTLSDWAKIPCITNLQNKLFIENILVTNRHVSSIGGALILREHSHADYCVGEDYKKYSSVEKILDNHFSILKVVSVRDPIESYISLLKNEWLHFKPASFDEYCKRYLAFISNFDKKRIVKYEDFIINPTDTMRYICRLLNISFNESFIDIFDMVNMTGDSGRKSSSISSREKKSIPDYLEYEIKKSKNYISLCETLAY